MISFTSLLDEETTSPVEIVLPTTFESQTTKPCLVIYLFAFKFVAIRVEVVDKEGVRYSFEYSNRRSHVVIEEKRCEAPLVIERGKWQYVKIDMEESLKTAFSADFYSMVSVCLTTKCRILRLYAADKGDYSDIELPEQLRLCRTSKNV